MSIPLDVRTGTDWGLREVSVSDPARLRLFFLSLLWRAAASSLPEMSDINLRSSDFRRLTRMVREGGPLPLGFFPVTLTQISDRGPAHNMAPVARDKESFRLGKVVTPRRKIFRFYLDGLAIQFDQIGGQETVDRFGPMCVGYSDRLVLSTVSYNRSWQRHRMASIFGDTFSREANRVAGYVDAGATFVGAGISREDHAPSLDLQRLMQIGFDPSSFPYVGPRLADER